MIKFVTSFLIGLIVCFIWIQLLLVGSQSTLEYIPSNVILNAECCNNFFKSYANGYPVPYLFSISRIWDYRTIKSNAEEVIKYSDEKCIYLPLCCGTTERFCK